MAARGKFSSDLWFNAAAFGGSAVLGVLLNLFIVRYHDAAALGVFNQVYAVYILLSQLAVGGVHLAVQAIAPRELQAGRSYDAGLTATLLLSGLSSVIVMAVAWTFRDLPGRWFSSPGVEAGFPPVIIGLLFFSWNKVLLSFHNGARRMRLFAVFQFLRFAGLLGGVMWLSLEGAAPWRLPVVLAWTEIGLFALLLPLTLKWWRPWKLAGLQGALVEHFRFGNRALPGNLLLDVNTRVDVFMLGLFTGDAAVGLYSFAATVAEGALQLPVLFRNNINPVIASAWTRGGRRLLNKLLPRNRKAFFRILAPLMLLSIALFPLALWVLGMQEEPMTVWAVYAILALGIAASSGHQPFLMLFSQLGRPGTQTLFIAGVFLSNVLLNLALIPWLGLYGAALATALSFLVLAGLLTWLARRTFDVVL